MQRKWATYHPTSENLRADVLKIEIYISFFTTVPKRPFTVNSKIHIQQNATLHEEEEEERKIQHNPHGYN